MLNSRAAKLLIGIATLLPLAYCTYFFWRTFVALNFGMPWLNEENFSVFLVMSVSVALLTFGLLVFYIVHLFRTTLVENDKKALWGVILIFGNVPAMVVYWVLYVWRAPSHMDVHVRGMD